MTEQKKDDGGSAYPVVAANGLGHVADGMTLRDWFAGMAIQGINAHLGERIQPEIAASWAYADADAMLKERAK